MVDYLHHEPRRRLGSTSSLKRKRIQVLEITRNDPTTLRLPVIVIYQHFQLVTDPLVGRNIASLPSHRHRSQGRSIVLIHPTPVVVLLTDRTQTSRTRIQPINLVLLNYLPQRSRVRQHRFPLVQNSSCSSQQRPVNREVVTHHPANITSCKVSVPQMDVIYVVHIPVYSHRRPPVVPHDTFRLPCSSRSIQNVQVVRTLHFLTRNILELQFLKTKLPPTRITLDPQIRSLPDQHLALVLRYPQSFSKNLDVVHLFVGLQTHTSRYDCLRSAIHNPTG